MNRMDERQLEKIRIFLTDQARGRRASRVMDLSNHIMLTVAEFYKNRAMANEFREGFGITSAHTMGWDSGGFQFLMGKLKGVPMETLPCGIEVPIDASSTIDLYKRVGVVKRDLPIQLDLPPRWDLSPEMRDQLIRKSASYYWEMLEEIPYVVPVIHGWTLEEIKLNLELVEDPDSMTAVGSNIPLWARNKSGVAAGSNAGSRNNWTMGNMNPHNGRVAAGAFTSPDKSAVDYVGPHKKKVAVGTFKGLTVPDYLKYAISSKARVVATPTPTRVEAAMAEPHYASPRRAKVAAGTFQALQTGSISEKKAIATGTQAAGMVVGKKRASYKVIIDRIALVLNYLRDSYDVFMLGGASPHMQHQIFLAGAKWTDTSAWRIKAVLGEIYLPDHSSGHSSFGIGYSQKAKRMDQEAAEILKDCLYDPTHPFSGLHWKEFMRCGHLLMPRWKKEVLKRNYPAKPFNLRALHNAWVLKCKEETRAREFEADPDGYYRYLRKRLKDRPILSKRLKSLYERIKHPYVQSKLGIYLKPRE